MHIQVHIRDNIKLKSLLSTFLNWLLEQVDLKSTKLVIVRYMYVLEAWQYDRNTVILIGDRLAEPNQVGTHKYGVPKSQFKKK